MFHREVLDDHHPRVIAAIREERNRTSLRMRLMSLRQSRRWSSTHLRTCSEVRAPTVKAPRRERRSLGKHLFKHPAARVLDSQSTNTRHDIMSYMATCNHYGIQTSEKNDMGADLPGQAKKDTMSVNVLKLKYRVESGIIIVQSRTGSGVPASRAKGLVAGAQRCAGEIVPFVVYY